MGIPLGIGGVLVLLVGSWLTGVNLFDVVGSGTSAGVSDTAESRPASSTPQEEQMVDFVDAVMGDIQKTWTPILPNYQRTQVVLFRSSIQSACGLAGAASGPFYCPNDRKVYLDLSFFDELKRRFQAPGDFAQAYVIAHEVGHHVQNLTGVLEREPFNGNANERSVRVELQADCYAGVWGHQAAQPGRYTAGGVELDPGDVEEALNAAAAIGDDQLQKKSTGRVVPESFTHGSSAQRVGWFKRGMERGDPRACDTFANPQ
jgi:predicted metalloprotease